MLPAALADAGLEEDRLVLLIHSGSRGVGESVLRDHINRFGANGLADDSADARHYLAQHEHALNWARANRALIARRFLSLLGEEGRPVLDLCHNSITHAVLGGQACWLHRKGAAPSDSGPVVIPGSRGTLSYLVMPCGDQEANAFSVAHGAGRKWARTDARGRLERQYSVESLQRTDFGGRVICDDKELLYEEAPQAYKNIDIVIQDLVHAGIVQVLATLRPLITYKVRSHQS
jgi:release factor H-coupled RctB family protein